MSTSTPTLLADDAFWVVAFPLRVDIC